MEEKRILWISAAVGIFLLIVIGAAWILYAPHKNADSASALTQEQNGNTWILTPQASGSAVAEIPSREASDTDREVPAHPAGTAPTVLPSDAAASNAPSGSMNTVQSNDLTIISNNTTVLTKDGVTTIDLTASGRAPEQQVIEAPAGSQNAPDVKTVVPAQSGNEARAAETTQTPNVKPAKSAQNTQTQKNAPPAKKAAAAKPANTAAKNTGKPKAAAAKTANIPDRFWVQAASFTDKENAENARSILASEKIPAEVFTYRDKSGKTFYRLRVGPYTTESEAQYWNSRIKLIEHFSSAQSYVTNSSKPLR
ncbi:hypothetical protein HMPREF9194_01854 [Treponema maltophilum ATCC 51939]|uniref:SPOR domain-containing protein n=1 Tax=Treponema maltophilum ATCC 51939 TaxID=1125699 RepID=S3KH11_TREMA|nr:SPOR domain-containing protein [Treponema maltophilum]EPF31507.1 hypothetical protein HMPREF9194_01854 [Treponema maltophilum ATCC 51939]